MENTPAAMPVPLPPPEKPARRKLWFAVVTVAVLAFIAASAWYCVRRVQVTRKMCGGELCAEENVSAWRCEPLLGRLSSYFR